MVPGIYQGYRHDGFQFGYNIIRATADVVGGWAGSAVGLKIGGIVGTCIGGPFGAVVGDIVGGIGGAFGGSYIGIFSVDKAYGR